MPKKPYKNELVSTDADAEIEIQIAEILCEHGDRSSEWLLITQQTIFPCEAHVHANRDSLIGDMADALTCRCFIAAVYHRGRRLSEDEIVPLRSEAMDNLGPISRARADGLF